MAYTPNPAAAARRAQLHALVQGGIARMLKGAEPTPEQAEAIRNAYRTAKRAEREGARPGNTAKQIALALQIDAAREQFAIATGTARPVAPPASPAPAAPLPFALDPFTGAPLPPANLAFTTGDHFIL